jgi:NAD+ dependent glucose-6-phosphate dehydrogenase
VSGDTPDVSGEVSDNDRKYYSIERAREVLGYDPQDNSAEWDGDERVQ